MKAIQMILLYACFGILFTSANFNTRDYCANVPPGTTRIAENLYCDRSEITNLDWCEYLYWNKRVYGRGSEEYKATLPDSNVWNGPCADKTRIFYLRHPYFRLYPVVGISQPQALQFCKWRTDRVFEYILVAFGKFTYPANPGPDEIFTIEKYFSGKYMNINPDTTIMYYPEYSLPGDEERKSMLRYSDSLERTFRNKKTRKYSLSEDAVNITMCLNDSLIRFPTVQTRPRQRKVPSHLENLLFHLQDNVSEWSSVPGKCYGNNWNNSPVDGDPVYNSTKQENWIGFRCVCRWKKFEK